MSENKIDHLLQQAKPCRKVAGGSLERMRQALLTMAREYEEEADALKLEQKPGDPSKRK